MHFIKCNFNQVQSKLINKESLAESKFVELLRKSGIYYRRERGKYRFGQEWCYYDFFLPYYRIYVEIDGKEHQNENVRHKDKIKEKYISNNQSFMARFTNEEVMAMDEITLTMLIERVAKWLQSRRKVKNQKTLDYFINKYWENQKQHLEQSEQDMRKDDLVPIDEGQPIFLYDHYNGEFYEFSNIIYARQCIKEFSLPKLYDLIYNFEYKKSTSRRFILGTSLVDIESKIAKVYY